MTGCADHETRRAEARLCVLLEPQVSASSSLPPSLPAHAWPPTSSQEPPSLPAWEQACLWPVPSSQPALRLAWLQPSSLQASSLVRTCSRTRCSSSRERQPSLLARPWWERTPTSQPTLPEGQVSPPWASHLRTSKGLSPSPQLSLSPEPWHDSQPPSQAPSLALPSQEQSTLPVVPSLLHPWPAMTCPLTPEPSTRLPGSPLARSPLSLRLPSSSRHAACAGSPEAAAQAASTARGRRATQLRRSACYPSSGRTALAAARDSARALV